MVVPLDVDAFVEDQVGSRERSGSPALLMDEPVYRLQPSGYILGAVQSHTPGLGATVLNVSREVVLHSVTWYIRRLSPGHQPSAGSARACGLDWYGRAPAALSALRAIIQVA